MNEIMRKRLMRVVENLPDEMAYQALEYLEFLESRHGTGAKVASTFDRLAEVAARFLHLPVTDYGYVLRDDHMRVAVRQRCPVVLHVSLRDLAPGYRDLEKHLAAAAAKERDARLKGHRDGPDRHGPAACSSAGKPADGRCEREAGGDPQMGREASSRREGRCPRQTYRWRGPLSCH